jgi:hypothetical protein
LVDESFELFELLVGNAALLGPVQEIEGLAVGHQGPEVPTGDHCVQIAHPGLGVIKVDPLRGHILGRAGGRMAFRPRATIAKTRVN